MLQSDWADGGVEGTLENIKSCFKVGLIEKQSPHRCCVTKKKSKEYVGLLTCRSQISTGHEKELFPGWFLLSLRFYLIS